jgi:uncharacterized BrkB/YihY/UPF0761 family membrane protein
MAFLIFSGVVACIFGLLLLVSHRSLQKLNVQASKLMSDIDSFVYKYRQGIGICFLLSGTTLLFVAYYLYRGR